VLQRQIEAGGPADVFASASPREMDELERRGLLAPGTRTVFAGNGVVLIVPAGSKPGIAGFADLGMDTVRRIAVGDPATVPAGTYADEALRSLGLEDLVRDKLVFAANVRQIIDYTARGETDAGIVFATDALGVPGVVTAGRAPTASHSAVRYHIAVIRGAANETAACAFIGMLRSREGQAMLRKRGFLSVP
jgi:molybdate transport system substrate-binding protein